MDRTAFVACLTGVDAAPLAYVPNEGSASISVIDTATDKVVVDAQIRPEAARHRAFAPTASACS